MISFFTTAKPFIGHSAVIQRNALKSWTLLHPDVEVILFGDDQGAAEVCAEFRLRHEPHVQRNSSGLKRIDYYWDRAQQIARHDILCYANCDIIFLPDFPDAVQAVRKARPQFLMVGRRWDVDISAPLDFADPSWAAAVRSRAAQTNDQRDSWWIDYFAFSRGLYAGNIPPFVIGRVAWDNWLLWYGLHRGVSVVDASRSVRAVHQNHGYGYHPFDKPGVWTDEHAQQNLRLAGGWSHLRNIGDSTEILDGADLRPNLYRFLRAVARGLTVCARVLRYDLWHPLWFALLDITRPVRRALGLRPKHSGSRTTQI